MGKTNPLNESDLDNFIKLAKTQKHSDNSWSIDIDKVNKESWSIEVSNPNIIEEKDERTSVDVISEIEENQKNSEAILKEIKGLL